MNKIRGLGILLLLIVAAIYFLFENDFADFMMGILLGAGLALTIMGRFKPTSKQAD
jgi:membrane-bound ClpP family serine protease